MHCFIEISGWTFNVLPSYSQHDEGIGEFEFWGHKEIDVQKRWRLDEAKVSSVDAPDGTQYNAESFPQGFLQALVEDNWDDLEEQMLSL
jgi:hypothetical protein